MKDHTLTIVLDGDEHWLKQLAAEFVERCRKAMVDGVPVDQPGWKIDPRDQSFDPLPWCPDCQRNAGISDLEIASLPKLVPCAKHAKPDARKKRVGDSIRKFYRKPKQQRFQRR